MSARDAYVSMCVREHVLESISMCAYVCMRACLCVRVCVFVHVCVCVYAC